MRSAYEEVFEQSNDEVASYIIGRKPGNLKISVRCARTWEVLGRCIVSFGKVNLEQPIEYAQKAVHQKGSNTFPGPTAQHVAITTQHITDDST